MPVPTAPTVIVLLKICTLSEGLQPLFEPHAQMPKAVSPLVIIVLFLITALSAFSSLIAWSLVDPPAVIFILKPSIVMSAAVSLNAQLSLTLTVGAVVAFWIVRALSTVTDSV